MLFDSTVPYLRISWNVMVPSIVLTWAFFLTIVGLTVKSPAPAAGNRL